MANTESYLLRHAPCPRCRAKGQDRTGNNLGVYSDGHTFCFNCHFYVPSSGNNLAAYVNRSNSWGVERIQVNLPADSCFDYPKKALDWIKLYDLSRNDMLVNRVLWSDSSERLIFPIYGDNGILAYQGRYFGNGLKIPKWWGQGDLKNVFHFLGKGDILVLVEDIISAIKVSKYYQAMPLFGSHISIDRFKRLYSLLGNLVEVKIWLDPDKRKESVKYSKRGMLCGLNTSTVLSSKDPKEHGYDEIRTLIDRM